MEAGAVDSHESRDLHGGFSERVGIRNESNVEFGPLLSSAWRAA